MIVCGDFSEPISPNKHTISKASLGFSTATRRWRDKHPPLCKPCNPSLITRNIVFLRRLIIVSKSAHIMNDTLPKEVHHQKALFSRDLPFKPQYGMMLYVEAGANEEIDGYFHKNMIG